MSGDVFSLSRSATDQFAHDDDTLSRVVTTDSNSKSSNSRGNRNLRVFMSSTFSDMSEERHALAKYVFPQVKYYYEDRGLIFSDVRYFHYSIFILHVSHHALFLILL